MIINRRQFLNAAISIGAGVLCKPLEVLIGEEKNKICIDAYISTIAGDRISNSMIDKQRYGLWPAVFSKVRDFYSDIFAVDVNFYKNKEVDKRNLSTSHIAVEYTTMDDMFQNPREIISAFGGDELIIELESQIKKAQYEQGWEYHTAEDIIFNNVKKGIKHHFSGEGGFGSKRAHRIWVYPSTTYDTAKNDQELVNGYAFVITHEIGHTLSLKHPKQGFSHTDYGPHNIMIPTPELKDVFSFNFTLHPLQMRQIHDYLIK